MMESTAISERIYSALVEDEDARVCKDIPDGACSEQPRAFTLQLVSQILTKLGDALTSSRLVLAWMLSALGAPAVFISLLVPVRESLSLLPQLFVAAMIRRQPIRKTFWVWGSVGQGICLVVMATAVLGLQGAALGLAVLASLALFSLSRGVCSVAAKDVLGKTVSKSRRGRLTGLAASISGGLTLVVAGCIALQPLLAVEGGAGSLLADPVFFAGILIASALLWFSAASVYAAVPEVPGAIGGGGNAIAEALRSLNLLRTDSDLREFVIARMLLVATAFAIPYLVVVIQQYSTSGNLSFAALLMAEGIAGLLSGAIWGRWSDTGSERVMAAAAAMSLLLILVVLALSWVHPQWIGTPPLAGLLLFVAAAAHHGARIGRKTYLVDMATSDNRAQYTAVSNTVMGVFLLSGALLGWVDTLYGSSAVLALLAAVAAAAVWRCATLRPVQ